MHKLPLSPRLLLLLLAAGALLASTAGSSASGNAASPGDVDCDGFADTADLVEILRHVGGLDTSAGCLPDAGDTDCDGDRDVADAHRLLLTLAGVSVPEVQDCGQIMVAPAVADVVPELEFLGDLASVDSRVTEEFGAAEKTLNLPGGASLHAPAGAFPSDTDLTVTVVDVDLTGYVQDPLDAAIYHLSTDSDVTLNQPVILDIPVAPGAVNVTELINGQWSDVVVQSGSTTQIEITHFSDHTLSVSEAPPDQMPEPAPGLPDDPEGATTADAIIGCMQFLLNLYEPDSAVPPAVFDIMLRICTEALINVLEPAGEQADVGCVADNIGDSTGLQDAVDACTLIERKGTLDSNQLKIDPEVNYQGGSDEIYLSVPLDLNGAANGHFFLDSTEDHSFYYSSQCWLKQTWKGTLNGTLDTDNAEIKNGVYQDALTGTADLTVTYEVTAGDCEGGPSLPTNYSIEVPWICDWLGSANPQSCKLMEVPLIGEIGFGGWFPLP